MTRQNRRTICLFFQVHQPFRLKTYRFFEIGADHHYYDEYQNRKIVQRIARDCYLPANEVLLDIIRKNGADFKLTFSISGTALEQFMTYAPAVIESFRRLFSTGNVEFVAQSFAHSLAMLTEKAEYQRPVKHPMNLLNSIFGCTPTTFITANLVYSDEIAELAQKLGFNTILTEGAPRVLGWISANYLYFCDKYPDVRLLLRNYQLSDDIAYRFSMREWNKWPLKAEKSLLNSIDPKEKLVNLFMDYGTLGEFQKPESGIFSFMAAFAEKIIASKKWNFRTVSDATKKIKPAVALQSREAISWSEQDHDLIAWLGNDLQMEAYSSLYSVSGLMQNCQDQELLRDWNRLQTCDHFYYMSTKYQNDGSVQRFFSPYSSPFEAFINYMNVLSDFLIRVHEYEVKSSFSAAPHNEQEYNFLEAY